MNALKSEKPRYITVSKDELRPISRWMKWAALLIALAYYGGELHVVDCYPAIERTYCSPADIAKAMLQLL